MSVCRSLVDRRQRPNPDTGGKATAAAGDGQDRLEARCVTDAEGEGLPGLARALRRGKPDPAKASGTWRHPRPLSGRRKSRFWRIERPATSAPRRAPVSGSQREGPSPGSGVRISPAKVRRDTGPGRVLAGWIQGGDHRPFPSRFAASSSRMNEARFEYRKPRMA